MSSQTPADAPRTLTATLLTALLALVFGFLGAAVWSYSGLADNRTRTFLLANPDLLPQMAEAFEAQEAAKRLTEMGGEVFTPFPGVVLGNPQGKTVLVEFTDYNCPYCEASLKDVKRLVAEDPDLKVVIREWPIFEGSDEVSRMALARDCRASTLRSTMRCLPPVMPPQRPRPPGSTWSAPRVMRRPMPSRPRLPRTSITPVRWVSPARRHGSRGTSPSAGPSATRN